MICKRCGAKNNDNAVFCMNCGVKIGSGVRIFNESNSVSPSVTTKSPVLIILGLIFAIISPIIGIVLGVVGRFFYSSRLQRRKSIYNIIIACVSLFIQIILFMLLILIIMFVILVVLLAVALILLIILL